MVEEPRGNGKADPLTQKYPQSHGEPFAIPSGCLGAGVFCMPVSRSKVKSWRYLEPPAAHGRACGWYQTPAIPVDDEPRWYLLPLPPGIKTFCDPVMWCTLSR